MNIKRFNFFAETAFIAMNAVKYRYLEEEGDSLRRILYGQCFGYRKDGIRSGCISENAILEEAECDDHYLSPLQVAAFIYESDDDYYLKNFDAFKDMFKLCCYTHRVTPNENKKLSHLKGKILTRDKYKHLGIKLYKNNEEIDNTIITPIGYDDYEQKKIDGPLNHFF